MPNNSSHGGKHQRSHQTISYEVVRMPPPPTRLEARSLLLPRARLRSSPIQHLSCAESRSNWLLTSALMASSVLSLCTCLRTTKKEPDCRLYSGRIHWNSTTPTPQDR